MSAALSKAERNVAVAEAAIPAANPAGEDENKTQEERRQELALLRWAEREAEDARAVFEALKADAKAGGMAEYKSVREKINGDLRPETK